MKKLKYTYTLRYNVNLKRATIRVYDGLKLIAKYRTGREEEEDMVNMTELDILNYLQTSQNYWEIKK